MRENLMVKENERLKFTGVVERFGTKNGYMGEEPTILLLDVKDDEGNVVTEHLWFNLTKGFEKLNLLQGDKVQFVARVKEYTKGYRGYRDDVYKPIERDYKLSHPTKVIKLKEVS